MTGNEASAEGYGPSRLDHVVADRDPNPDEQVLRLFAGVDLVGHIFDRGTRQPVAGARVCLADNRSRRTGTDGDGRFLLKSLAPGDVLLRIEAEGYPVNQIPLSMPSGTTSFEQRLELSAGSVVRGVVRDEAGKPRPAVTVVLWSDETWVPSRKHVSD